MGRHSSPDDPGDAPDEQPFDDYPDDLTTQLPAVPPGPVPPRREPEPPRTRDDFGRPGPRPGYGAPPRPEFERRDPGYRDTGPRPGDYRAAGRPPVGPPPPGRREPDGYQAGFGSTEYPDDGFADDEYGDDEYGDDGYGDAGFEDTDFEGEDYPESDYWSDEDPELDPREQQTRSFATTTPPPRAPVTGPQHGGDWEGGDWTGSHRAVSAKRRGVSKGVIGALAAVVVIVGAFILWRFFGNVLSSRSEAAAARCVSGDVAVAVLADPSIVDQIRTFADKYNQTATPVGDKCVKVGVRAADSEQVVDGFAGNWPAELGDKPALWIPGSSVSAARVEAASGAKAVTTSRSLVTSPVMLAMRPELKTALGQQGWGNLPGLQTNPTALDGLNLQGWGPLRLALPLQGNSDATYLAAEAVAAAAAPQGAPATAGAGAISTLMAGQPKLSDAKESTALDALLGDGAPAAAQVHAVVTTEQQIFQRAASMPDAKSKLAAWLPSGSPAVADYPTVLLSGDPLSQEQVTAASEFERFLHKPETLAELAKAGFRVDGATMPSNDVTQFSALSGPPLSVGDKDVRVTLANAVSAPAQNSAVTIMLDQSMNTDEGGKSRVANVAAAIETRLQALPPTAVAGLWTFDGVAGRSEVATGPLGDQLNGQPRSSVLAGNLNGQVASGGGAVSFTTLRALYTDAVANFREGQENSVLVITTGPHTDQSLDGAGLQDFIKQNFSQAKPVAVNVIDFGGDPDRSTWEGVAQTTGGTYQNLNSSSGPELGAALATVLG